MQKWERDCLDAEYWRLPVGFGITIRSMGERELSPSLHNPWLNSETDLCAIDDIVAYCHRVKSSWLLYS